MPVFKIRTTGLLAVGLVAVPVKNINAAGSAHPANLVNVGAKVFFSANDGGSGQELWSSDGTASGTALVRDIATGSSGSSPNNLTELNGALYFTANDGAHGFELWKSDGTPAGTVLVKDITPGTSGSFFIGVPNGLTNVNGMLFFGAQNSANGRELWMSDGTEDGTLLVMDIAPGLSSSMAFLPMVTADGTLFFRANNVVNGQELWASGLQKNLLANDTDTDSPTLTATLGTGPTNGALVLNSDGTFTYRPNAGFTGTDTFTYSVSDGTTTSNLATVTITVA